MSDNHSDIHHNHPPTSLIFNCVVRHMVGRKAPHHDLVGTPFDQEVGLKLGSLYRERCGWPVTIVKEVVVDSQEHQFGFRFWGDNHILYRANGTTSLDGSEQMNDVVEILDEVPENEVTQAIAAYTRPEKRTNVEVGKTYTYAWPDGQSIAQYTVLAIFERSYDVIYSNGVRNNIQFGCPLNLGSVELNTETLLNLRNAALTVQTAVGEVLASGGLHPDTWFEYLRECQNKLASQTNGKRVEFERIRRENERPDYVI